MPSLRAGRRSSDMEDPRQSSTPFRTAEVLYLLSRGAHLEHPHMINVQYAAHQPGPTLKDVKVRLNALRGKGMPDSFSWSYKRNYKDTFIWCDMFDDDFILPLNGTGEFVLKAMEFFDASQDDEDFSEYEELHSAREPLPFRSPRVSSPSKSLRPSTRQEHLHVESDVSMAIRKSLLLIGDAGNITSANSVDLNKQIMKSFSNSQRAPEVCSLDHSDVSSNGTYPSFEDAVENKKHLERQRPKTIVARTERAVVAKHCNADSQTVCRETSLHGVVISRGTSPAHEHVVEVKESSGRHRAKSIAAGRGRLDVTKQCNIGSQTAFREPSLARDVTTDCKELVDQPTTMTKDAMPAYSPSPTTTPTGKRRTWEKEIDKSTIYTEFSYSKSSDDEEPSPLLEVRDIVSRSSSPCLSAPDDPFLYGVLRKATRFGGFRPKLCRGVDVIDSTRAKTKMHFRSKTKESPVKQASSLANDSSRRTSRRNSFTEAPEKQDRLPEMESYVSPDKPVKVFRTLSQYFETKERNSPVDKLMSGPQSAEETPRRHLSIAQSEPRPPSTAALAIDSQETGPPRTESRPFGNDALDASYRKTMEVLAKLPTSRGVCKMHTIPQSDMEIPETAVRLHPVSQGGTQKARAESKDNKHEAKLYAKSPKASTPSRKALKPRVEPDAHNSCSIHGMHGPTAGKTPEECSKSTTSKQRRPSVKKLPGETNNKSEPSISSYSEKTPEKAIKTSRNSSKESCSKLPHGEQINRAEDTNSQVSESFTFDSHISHNGNQQGSKMTTPVVTKAEAAVETTPNLSTNEGTKGWPFEQPVRPRDFKSREDRLLTPGLTQTDWERSLQEAVMHSEPPPDLVLHECSAMTGCAIAAAGLPHLNSEIIDPSVLQPSFESYMAMWKDVQAGFIAGTHAELSYSQQAQVVIAHAEEKSISITRDEFWMP